MDAKALNARMERIKQGKDYRLDTWNIDYEKHRYILFNTKPYHTKNL